MRKRLLPVPEEGNVRGFHPDPAACETRLEPGHPLDVVQRVLAMEGARRGSGLDGDAPVGFGKNGAAVLAPLAKHLKRGGEKPREPIGVGAQEREVMQRGGPEKGRRGGGGGMDRELRLLAGPGRVFVP